MQVPESLIAAIVAALLMLAVGAAHKPARGMTECVAVW